MKPNRAPIPHAPPPPVNRWVCDTCGLDDVNLENSQCMVAGCDGVLHLQSPSVTALAIALAKAVGAEMGRYRAVMHDGSVVDVRIANKADPKARRRQPLVKIGR